MDESVFSYCPITVLFPMKLDTPHGTLMRHYHLQNSCLSLLPWLMFYGIIWQHPKPSETYQRWRMRRERQTRPILMCSFEWEVWLVGVENEGAFWISHTCVFRPDFAERFNEPMSLGMASSNQFLTLLKCLYHSLFSKSMSVDSERRFNVCLGTLATYHSVLDAVSEDPIVSGLFFSPSFDKIELITCSYVQGWKIVLC